LPDRALSVLQNASAARQNTRKLSISHILSSLTNAGQGGGSPSKPRRQHCTCKAAGEGNDLRPALPQAEISRASFSSRPSRFASRFYPRTASLTLGAHMCGDLPLRSRRSISRCAADVHCWGTGGDSNFKALAQGEDGETKPMWSGPVTSLYFAWPGIFCLRAWPCQTPHCEVTRLCVPVFQTQKVGSRSALLYSSPTTCDQPQESRSTLDTGQMFGLHNLRHSLSTGW